MTNAVELGALEGRRARSIESSDSDALFEFAGGTATSFPRLPRGVGVPVILCDPGRSDGLGKGLRVQCPIVLRQ